jgi:hypothetical protein
MLKGALVGLLRAFSDKRKKENKHLKEENYRAEIQHLKVSPIKGNRSNMLYNVFL